MEGCKDLVKILSERFDVEEEKFNVFTEDEISFFLYSNKKDVGVIFNDADYPEILFRAGYLTRDYSKLVERIDKNYTVIGGELYLDFKNFRKYVEIKVNNVCNRCKR